jgi:very-short-patch-repair endonuclease
MPRGVYVRTDAMKAQCRLNASKAGGFHGAHSDVSKEKMRAAKLANPTRHWLGKKRGPCSEETKQKMREAKKKSGFAPSPETRRLARKLQGTKIECRISEYLRDAGIPYFSQFIVGTYACDFVIPMWNVAIECDGTFWHTGRYANPKREKRRDAFITAQGIDVVRIPEEVIKDDARLLITMQGIARRGVRDGSTEL